MGRPTLGGRSISSVENRVQGSYCLLKDQPMVSRFDLTPVWRDVKIPYLANMDRKYVNEDHSRIVCLCRRDHEWIPIFGFHVGD